MLILKNSSITVSTISVIRTMSAKNKTKKTVAKKLMQKKAATKIVPTVPDIEDTVKISYFSPVQTRKQRQSNKVETVKKEDLEESTTKPLIEPSKLVALKSAIKIKDEDNNKPPLDIKKPLPETAEKWEPKQWREMLANIRQMRSSADAPVDSMGCHKCSDDGADEKTQRYQKLVALMLSSQTKDDVTYEAMQRLRAAGLTPPTIVAMQVTKLEELLRPVSFYKNKAKYLQQTAQILIDKYDSDIPNNIKELIALPGVGPKMAHLCMATAWNEVTGIGVDVHVHRIVNRLKWLPQPTKEPEQTRMALESWLPRNMWQDVNHLLVGFGQTVCTAVRPHCAECSNRMICPAAPKAVKKEFKDDEANSDAVVAIKKAKFHKKKMHL